VTRKAAALALEIAVPLALLAIWWLWSTSRESFYFPPLPDILTAFGDTWIFERAGSDLVPSLARLLAGYAIAAVIGVGGGLLLGVSGTARRIAEPVIQFVRAIPPTALIPAAIVALGVGDVMRVSIITIACIWPILLNTIDGVAGVETTLLETARSYAVRPFDRLRYVIFPAALPQIFAGLRISLSIAIVVMVVSEMVASTDGIGFFVLHSQSSFAISEMWSGILVLGILGYLLNLGFTQVERRMLRWHRGARASALSDV
jgi:ABC-type nitrate/sulfonate/bicarbonate transport system permease component